MIVRFVKDESREKSELNQLDSDPYQWFEKNRSLS